VSDVEFLELLNVLLLTVPPAGGAVSRSSENDDMSIAGQLAIHLDRIGTGFDRLLKARQVFSGIAGGARWAILAKAVTNFCWGADEHGRILVFWQTLRA
jgi:hypothetical protein